MNKTSSLKDSSIQFGLLAKIAVIKGRIGVDVDSADNAFFKDDEGNEICNIHQIRKEQQSDARKAAIRLHGNDPKIRLDMCRFPILNREFMLSYDYLNTVKGFNFNGWDWQFLTGPPGTGKTTLACRQAWEWMSKDPLRKVTFLSIVDWIRDLQRSFGNNDQQFEDLPKFKPFVILDDFDKIQYTDWQILQIFRLIDYLYRTDKKVIITSNRTLDGIIEESDYNGNIKTAMDRIRGRCRGAIIALNGKSYR